VTPERIQLRRTKGWRKPEGAIVVSRPSRWGNWYVIKTASEWRHGQYFLTEDLIIKAVNKWGHETGAHWAGFADMRAARLFAVELFERSLLATYLDVDGPLHRKFYLDGLEGHDLACWCPLDQPCHADVLLRLANP
jgi:hypothetical protein